MGMTNEQFDSHLRTMYFSARKAFESNDFAGFIKELEVTIGDNNVAIVEKRLAEARQNKTEP